MSLEIGLRLKEARESLGLTIQDIRDQTRIESGYLIALENGDFDKLPSPYFVRTCIRAYAKCVGIEPHHLLKKYHPIPGDSGASNSSKNGTRVDSRRFRIAPALRRRIPVLMSLPMPPMEKGDGWNALRAWMRCPEPIRAWDPNCRRTRTPPTSALPDGRIIILIPDGPMIPERPRSNGTRVDSRRCRTVPASRPGFLAYHPAGSRTGPVRNGGRKERRSHRSTPRTWIRCPSGQT